MYAYTNPIISGPGHINELCRDNIGDVRGMALAEVQERKTQRKTRGKPNAVDIHVGTRVRQRRTLLGFSQERLASALDLTFQQVQKYERGANRIGAGRLYQLARALEVPVTYFFEELDDSNYSNAAAGVTRDEE